MKYIYTLSKSVNYADTFRDSDSIHTEIIEHFFIKEKAEEFTKEYIMKEYKNWNKSIDLTKPIKFDEDGKWYCAIMGSYAPTFCLIKKEIR